MAHFEDLSTWPLPDVTLGTLKAVGWLELGARYARGSVSERFFEALARLLVEPWQPAASAGRHPCSFCKFSGGPTGLTYKGTTILLGASNVYVPGDGVIYVAPSLIAHYVDAHEYQPPAEFVDAVLRCPPMRSMPYLQAIGRIGGSALVSARVGKRSGG